MAFRFETERLVIRPWSPEDRDALARMAGDAVMMRYVTDGEVWSDQRVDELMARIETHLGKHGICFAAIEQKSTGEVVGLSGLQQLDDGNFELGWWVWKDYWGQGFALEGTQPFVTHARENMGLDRLVAVIEPENTASKRVAEKLGMHFECMKSAQQTMAVRPDRPIAYYAMTLNS